MPKNSVEKVDYEEATGEIMELPPAVQRMVLDLRQKAGEASDNPAQVSLDILERILTADTIEEAASGTTDMAEIIGQPLTITLKGWQASKLGQLGVFAVLDCKDDSGKNHVVSCGGLNVVAILYRCENEDRFPIRGKFRDVETNQGYTTLWLDILPE